MANDNGARAGHDRPPATATPPAGTDDATLPPDGDIGSSSTISGASGPAVADAAGTDALCGRRLQHFQVLARIGQGGMGAVYRAHDLSLDRIVALKVMAAALAADPAAHQRFTREARAQARLSHPNVVPIYYVGEQDGLCFFAMELIDGASLDDALRRGERLEAGQAIEHLLAVSSALSLAHKRGFIHRDIKPSNLLVDESGQVKVADFGLAKQVVSDVQLTQEGTVIGSPLYMSPEQGLGEAADFRSDVYSLGATFYHLLAGEPPHFAPTPMGIITKHATQPLRPLRSVAPDVPAALAAIIERMMEKDRARRYQSYEELIDALKAARPAGTAPAGFWVRAMALGADVVLFSVLAGIAGRIVWLLYPFYCIGGWWRWGQTIGKWLFRLQVRTLDNARLPLPRCALRFVILNWGAWAALSLVVVQRLVFGSWSLGPLPPPRPPALEKEVRQARWELEVTKAPQRSGHAVEAPPGALAGGPPANARVAPPRPTRGQLAFLAGHAAILLLYLASLAWAGLRRDRRALHDRACGSRVVYHLRTG